MAPAARGAFMDDARLHNGSPNSAAQSGGGCPARPTAAEAIWPTSHTPSQAVRILTHLIRSGADAGDPRCYRRMCRHARPRRAAVQIQMSWPLWADAAGLPLLQVDSWLSAPAVWVRLGGLGSLGTRRR